MLLDEFESCWLPRPLTSEYEAKVERRVPPWCRLRKKLWGWNMAISIAVTKRLTRRFEAGYLPVVNVKNELINAVGLASSYEANGNLTNRVYDATGPKTYVYLYDDENQLIEMRTDTSATLTDSRWRTTWGYDGVARARVRTDYTAGTTNDTNHTNKRNRSSMSVRAAAGADACYAEWPGCHSVHSCNSCDSWLSIGVSSGQALACR
jgi:hypothetical protein